jgi:hypothetical protein
VNSLRIKLKSWELGESWRLLEKTFPSDCERIVEDCKGVLKIAKGLLKIAKGLRIVEDCKRIVV